MRFLRSMSGPNIRVWASAPRWSRTAARHCAQQGAKSLFAWVLSGNPNRKFYERLGAKAVETSSIWLDNRHYDQVAYLWDDIAALLNR